MMYNCKDQKTQVSFVCNKLGESERQRQNSEARKPYLGESESQRKSKARIDSTAHTTLQVKGVMRLSKRWNRSSSQTFRCTALLEGSSVSLTCTWCRGCVSVATAYLSLLDLCKQALNPINVTWLCNGQSYSCRQTKSTNLSNQFWRLAQTLGDPQNHQNMYNRAQWRYFNMPISLFWKNLGWVPQKFGNPFKKIGKNLKNSAINSSRKAVSDSVKISRLHEADRPQ